MAAIVEETRTALGSGDIYLAEPTAEQLAMTDIDQLITTFCVDANRFGNTKNGGSVKYTQEKVVVEDDLGKIVETYLVKDGAEMTCGTITVGPEIIKKLTETGRVETTTSGRKVIKIGGVGNADGKSYLICFHHKNSQHGDIRVFLLGSNNSELSFAFDQQNPLVLTPTFTAKAMDAVGTKLIIVFDKNGTD